MLPINVVTTPTYQDLNSTSGRRYKQVLTGGGAAPDVTHHTDESERVGQLSTLWITGYKGRLMKLSATCCCSYKKEQVDHVFHLVLIHNQLILFPERLHLFCQLFKLVLYKCLHV